MFIPFHHFSLLRSFLLFYHRFIRGYIPPECYENSTISMMNDVYAFGVTVINIISVMCRNIQPYERLLCTWVSIYTWRHASIYSATSCSICYCFLLSFRYTTKLAICVYYAYCLMVTGLGRLGSWTNGGGV